MTDSEKISYVQALVGNDPAATNELCLIYLCDARNAILLRMYPFNQPEEFTIPDYYIGVQCKLAARYFLRRGAEGEMSHAENGISRTYESVSDEDLLREVMQVIKL